MPDHTDMTFKGTPVVGGQVRGRIKTVRGWEKDIALDPETVLITRFPIPRISRWLQQASALLCAYGASDSFLAAQARARGIPTVFNLGSSIEALPDAAWVLVDGTNGVVQCDVAPA
ncbi:MAG: PEP-utilizing enzyme [Anaerolineae bacterium]|nr:PEP-utilizing enzyme [Anaerolineae bacterium]